jgi:hypothetical protein
MESLVEQQIKDIENLETANLRLQKSNNNYKTILIVSIILSGVGGLVSGAVIGVVTGIYFSTL